MCVCVCMYMWVSQVILVVKNHVCIYTCVFICIHVYMYICVYNSSLEQGGRHPSNGDFTYKY